MTGVFQGYLSQNIEKESKVARGNLSSANQSRVLLGRLKDLLRAQQSRLDSYLAVLDRQYEAIENEGSEDILFYTELEEKIGRELLAIQKVCIPLERLYHATDTAEPPIDIRALKTTLEARKKEVQIRSRRNRDLLAQRMTLLRAQIHSLQASPLRRTSIYAKAGIPSRIDIWM
ncbi:MAG: flagellar biosynthesis protein FlgN [Treponema sp.]|jgi:hypothetical protein|nr:flagellar biosynthesis protein FlgN [Treponema sp.]